MTAADTTASVPARTLVLRLDRALVSIRRLGTVVLASKPRPAPAPFEGWGFLWRPAIIGFLALIAIGIGSSFPDSPFKLEMPGTWAFGVPGHTVSSDAPVNSTTILFGITLVYGGLVLLMRVWIRLAAAARAHPGAPVRRLAWILALWILPVLVIAPIFSRDVYSYAAQGEMASRGISPYAFGPGVLGNTPFSNATDPLWSWVPAPYGPLFVMIDNAIVQLAGHHLLTSVVGLRLLEVLAVVILAVAMPKLARALGYDPGHAFVMCLLNPLVVLTIVGGAHNDGLMVALLVAGLALAAKRHPVWGIVVCALATAIKVPAALGIVYIAWQWLGPDLRVRLRVRPLVVASLLAGAVFGGLTYVSGLGFGWVLDLNSPGKVFSWAAPATGLGMLLSQVCHLFGYGVSTTAMIGVTRVIGLAIAAGLIVWFLGNADRIGWLKALGLSMLAVVILGPVVQPWYLTWGLLLLAPLAVGRLRNWIIVLSVISPFVGLPGGTRLLEGIVRAPMIETGAVLLLLWLLLLAPLGRWTTYGHEPQPVPLLGPLALEGAAA